MRAPRFSHNEEISLLDIIANSEKSLWKIRVLNLRGHTYTWQYDAKHCILLWTRCKKAGLFSPKLLKNIQRWAEKLNEYAKIIFKEYHGEIISKEQVTISGAHVWLAHLLDNQINEIQEILKSIDSFTQHKSIPTKIIVPGVFYGENLDTEYVCPVSFKKIKTFKRVKSYKTVFSPGVARYSNYIGGEVIEHFNKLIVQGLNRRRGYKKLIKEFSNVDLGKKVSIKRIINESTKI